MMKNNNKVSIIIPSRNERFLSQTVDDIYRNAKGEIEVIVVLDGYWNVPDYWLVLKDQPNLSIIHFSESKGMRYGINAGVAISTGKYIMKADGHCAFDIGFDEKLKADCDKDWVAIPRRYSLDAELWQRKPKPGIDYMYLSYPGPSDDFGGRGLQGKVWDNYNRREDLKNELIVDQMSFQGSCWFMHKEYFEFLELMDENNWGTFWQEAQEIGLKAWFSGGRVIRNKKTWYAHLHKGKQFGRGYNLDHNQLTIGTQFCNKFATGKEKWHKQIPGRDLKWLVEHFSPVPGWPEDSKEWII